MIDALLERVYGKCIKDAHGCMNWTGAVQSRCKSPTMRKPEGGHAVPLRRLMFETVRGRPVPAERVVSYTCGNSKCVRLEHLSMLTRNALQKRNDAQFDAATRLRKSHRIAVKARARAKLTMEIAREIREADEPQRAIARRYGISQATVGSIRRGLTWREQSNPFAGLAA